MRNVMGMTICRLVRAGAALMAAAAMIVPAERAWGATHTNANGTTLSWSDAGTWTPSGTPAAGDTVMIDMGGTVQITNGTTATCGISGGEGSLSIDEGETGRGLGGTLEMDSGGVLNMNGAGIFVGHGMTNQTIGTLTVNGGVVMNVGSEGTASRIEVPREGQGVMTINSGSVFYKGIWMSHYQSHAEPVWGIINMNGGQLVRDGHCSSGNFTIGSYGTSTVVMTGGLIDDTGNGAYPYPLSIGSGGVGEFYQSGGTSMWYETDINNYGTLNVSGGTFLPNSLHIGNNPSNSGVAYLSGGILSNTQASAIGFGVGATGTVNISGSHTFIQMNNEVRIANGRNSVGTFNMSGGTVTNTANVPAGGGVIYGYGIGSTAYGSLTGGVMAVPSVVMGGANASGSCAVVTMSGAFALRLMGNLIVGSANNPSYAALTISNNATISCGGRLDVAAASVSGGLPTGIVNMVDGTVTASNNLEVGRNGNGRLTISGGKLECQQMYNCRYHQGFDRADVQITGGALYASNGIVLNGAAGYPSTVNQTGGVIDFGTGGLTLNDATGNTASNSGGVFQFAGANPTITPGAFGNIVLTNGTISFRNVANANIHNAQVSNIAFQGNNTFMLNASTNLYVGSYNFDSVANTGNPTNYQGLALINGNTMWQSASLNIGAGGAMLISNATATVSGVLTNFGAITVVNSQVTFPSNAVVGSSGYLSDLGGGNLWQFQGSFSNASTASNSFDMRNATVVFTNGGGVQHVFYTGSKDMGAYALGTGYASITNNFVIGTFRLAAGDTLMLTSAAGGAGNALYAGVVDLGGLANTNNLTLAVNLYYDAALAGNGYLGSNTYTLAGGGALIPYNIPAAAPTDFADWQIKYFGGTNGPNAGPQDDWDGDKTANWNEYIAGTDPTNPLSFFHLIAISNDASGCTVVWQSVTDRIYSVLKSTNLLGGWPGAALETNLPGDLGGTSMFPDTNATERSAFYRIKVRKP